MATFDEMLAADLDNIFLNEDEFAERVDYTQKGGATITGVSAIFTDGANLETGSLKTKHAGEFQMRFSEIKPCGAGDQVTRADNTVWTVERVNTTDGNLAVLSCRTDARSRFGV